MAITWPAKNNYATGDVLTATNMNGIGDDLNALFDNSFYAGKNKIINGDFRIWQRGTSFTNTSVQAYTADRWLCGSTADTITITQQLFTAGSAPVAGYEGTFYLQMAWASSLTGYPALIQRVEDVRIFAGQTVTMSFWAKAASNVTAGTVINQNFGSGGSATVATYGSNVSLTTSWQRFSVTINVPSISGKTLGTNSYLEVQPLFFNPASAANTIQIWGVQLEAGSTATPFQTATGTRAGELAACQRYYYRQTAGSAYGWMAYGGCQNTTNGQAGLVLPVQMRVVPTALEYANVRVVDSSYSGTLTTLALNTGESSPNLADIFVTGTGLTGGRPLYIGANNNTGAYLAVTAEL